MDAKILREVMGSTLPSGGYTKLIDAYNNAARAANINTVRRAAMWAAQLGHESVAETRSRNNRRPYGTIGDTKRLLKVLVTPNRSLTP